MVPLLTQTSAVCPPVEPHISPGESKEELMK
jgi:hypothetical protein